MQNIPKLVVATVFQSTPSARRATFRYFRRSVSFFDFNPRPPRGGRPGHRPSVDENQQISIHALREEGDLFRRAQSVCVRISIHALREEGDRVSVRGCSPQRDFNPRPPRGGRLMGPSESINRALFQSTPSARRATTGWGRASTSRSNFNPRPPRGERRGGESDGQAYQPFQSTPSARRATRTGRWRSAAPSYFNPRPPRGERQMGWLLLTRFFRFQSTPSARRATLSIRL